MRVIQETRQAGERVIALGTFDGVHKGHRSLIRCAKALATDAGVPLRVCTFNRHPLEVLQIKDPPELLSTVPEKASQLCKLGVDEMELIRFDRATADMEPEAFLQMLREITDLRAVVAGWNYTFGRKGRGNAEMLSEDGRAHGYRTLIVPPKTLEDGTAISSSLVRKTLKEGKIREAGLLLGYNYSLTGTVMQGKQKGRTLGFPTANIEPWKRKAFPKFGVYTCLLETEENTVPAVVNIGVQPTIPSGKVTVEAHVLTACPSLYGQKVRLTPIMMLREEKRFNTANELKEQIEKDKDRALKLFNMA